MYAQNEVKFYEVIEGDNLKFFFNKELKFTEEDCSDYVKYSRINSEGKYTGKFYNQKQIDSLIVLKGQYTNGLKYGLFEGFHDNGNLSLKGFYRENKPYGNWKHFSEDGSLNREVQFNGSDSLLITQIDSKGNELVKDGNGIFKGVITLLIGDGREMVAEGEIIDGKRHGKWIVYSSDILSKYGEQYLIENFDYGKFKKGKMIMTNSPYKNASLIGKFFRDRDIIKLENFNSISCGDYDFQKEKENGVEPFDVKSYPLTFINTIKKLVEQNVDVDAEQPKQYVLKILFEVNSEGMAEDIRKISSWGDSVYLEFEEIIASTNYPEHRGLLIFNLHLDRRAGNNTFSHWFSKE